LIWFLEIAIHEEKIKFAINSQKNAKIREFSANFRVISAKNQFWSQKNFGGSQKKIWGDPKLWFPFETS